MDRREKLKDSFLRFLRTMGDLMLLNWLCFFCCLPVVTLGPACCATYSVTLKLARGEHCHTLRDFFQAFRANFRQGLVLGLIAIVLAVLAVGDYLFALGLTGSMQKVYTVLAVLLLAALLTLAGYGFSLQAMFENPLGQQLKNAFSLAFVAPRKTLMIWLISIFPVAAYLVLPDYVIAMLGFLYLIFGLSGPFYLNSRLLRDVFDKVNGAPVRPVPDEEEE